MSKKRLSEKELLEGLTSHTGHFDELATISEKDWGAYSEDTDNAGNDFLVQRDDFFDDPRMEKMLNIAKSLHESGSIDGESLKEIKGLTELKTPSEIDYKMALKRIEVIFDAEPGTPEGDQLELLASFVEAYEDAQDRELIKQREDSQDIEVDKGDL